MVRPLTAPFTLYMLILVVALEGADLTVVYHPEEERDFKEMLDTINKKTNGSRNIVPLAYDLRKEEVCKEVIDKHLQAHGKLDALYVA